MPDRPKWSAADKRTSGATDTFRVTSDSVSAVVAGITERLVDVVETVGDFKQEKIGHRLSAKLDIALDLVWIYCKYRGLSVHFRYIALEDWKGYVKNYELQ